MAALVFTIERRGFELTPIKCGTSLLTSVLLPVNVFVLALVHVGPMGFELAFKIYDLDDGLVVSKLSLQVLKFEF